MRTARVAFVALLALFTAAGPVAAAGNRSTIQPADFSALGFAQHPGARVPLGTEFRDEQNRPVRLGQYFDGHPVVLVLEYLQCPNLCGFVLGNLAAALHAVPQKLGRDFNVVAISIDPRETPADARAAHAKYAPRFAATRDWHFLTGRAADIKAVADAIGFRYRYDPSIQQYAHAAGVTILSGDGRVSRYILGLDYRPLDLRLGLTEASAGHVSSPAAQILLLCYCYDPQTGRYSLAVSRLLQGAGLLTLLAVVYPIYRALRRELTRV